MPDLAVLCWSAPALASPLCIYSCCALHTVEQALASPWGLLWAAAFVTADFQARFHRLH